MGAPGPDCGADPFRHHPGLRGLIRDPLGSYFRDFDLAALEAQVRALGLTPFPQLTVAAREAGRRKLLAQRPAGDLWVFAYGSLMWDPAILFTEVRRARVADHARRFILKDTHGGRGDPENPGLFVALDRQPGAACDGLVLRLAEASIEDETRRLWTRERAGPAYCEAWLEAETEQGPVRAVTFVADPAAEDIVPDLSFDQQADYCATGRGVLGTSLDYLRGIAAHLAELAIPDPEVARLLAAAEARAAGGPGA